MTAGVFIIDLASVAEVLGEIGDEIEKLGVAICRDPAMAARYMHELQAIDLIAQKHRSLASLLQADCPASALSAIGLEDLKARIGHRMD